MLRGRCGITSTAARQSRSLAMDLTMQRHGRRGTRPRQAAAVLAGPPHAERMQTGEIDPASAAEILDRVYPHQNRGGFRSGGPMQAPLTCQTAPRGRRYDDAAPRSIDNHHATDCSVSTLIARCVRQRSAGHARLHFHRGRTSAGPIGWRLGKRDGRFPRSRRHKMASWNGWGAILSGQHSRPQAPDRWSPTRVPAIQLLPLPLMFRPRQKHEPK